MKIFVDILTYSLFGRYLRKGDAQKLAKFDKFFTLDPVEARRVFDTTYINGRTSQEQSKAKELLKDIKTIEETDKLLEETEDRKERQKLRDKKDRLRKENRNKKTRIFEKTRRYKREKRKR